MGREEIQSIQLVEGNSSNLQTNLTDHYSRRDLRRSYLDRNLEENASGETAVVYGKAKNQNLRHRSRSKQGKLQSAVPVPVPNHEHQMSEDVSIWSTLWRVVKGCHGFCLGDQHQHSIFTGFVVFEAISCLCYLLIGDGLWNILTGDLGMNLFLFAQFMTFIGIIKTSNAFTMSSINRHSDPVVMGILLSVQFLVFYSCFSLEPKNKESIITASVFRLVCYTVLVVLLSFKKEPSKEPSDPDDLRLLIDESLQRNVLTGNRTAQRRLRRKRKVRVQIDEDHHKSFQSNFRRSPDDLASRVSETDHQILPHDQSQYIQDGKLLILYLHQQYKNLALVVLYLILEAISLVLDFIGKGKLGFIVAAFVLALFVSIPTLWVYFKERSTRSQDERPIANVELLFSRIQLLTTLLHLIFELKGVDDKYNLYNLSFLPLAFAFYRVFSAVFAFRKEHENGTRNSAEPPAENQVSQHENGIRNAAEPPAENQVNQHDGSRNIMVHMRVTGKHLNMVIDLTMVTCYEQLFRKLRDEMFQAMEELWGDRPRWNVLYVDISDEVHYLREDEISWGQEMSIALVLESHFGLLFIETIQCSEFRMAARKICIYRKEVRKQLYRRWESMPRTSEKGSERALFT
ncbi:hypothetical protein Patl1_22514 [Pistacia atlantica]|uniref:Uncharacterized protein n=1 Tax=Pistacia atlantica TaxID=434234 RepID=A0ACC0ZTP9_9ROSI|nr:hypothetical protein Patl1_22514 [Pistacia atlantica]